MVRSLKLTWPLKISRPKRKYHVPNIHSQVQTVSFREGDTVDGSEIGQTHQLRLRLVVYPIIYKVLYIPAGFLNHQQYDHRGPPLHNATENPPKKSDHIRGGVVLGDTLII